MMKIFSRLILVTLAASLCGIGAAVSPCLNPANNNYKCDSSGNELDLYQCGITDSDVDDGSLKACFAAFGKNKIRFLSLHYNELSTVPSGLFNGLVSLKTLSLHQNKLSALPNRVFKGLASLKELSLHHNDLTSLPVKVFDGLGSLQVLSLESNELSTLSAGVFSRLGSLRSLNLKYNQLACLPKLPTLRRLIVDNGVVECGGN